MTERALTKEGIFKTFKLQVARREPRPDRVGKEGVPPFIDFVEFRDKQGVLRYATPVAHYDGPKIFSSESSPHLLMKFIMISYSSSVIRIFSAGRVWRFSAGNDAPLNVATSDSSVFFAPSRYEMPEVLTTIVPAA